MCSTPFVVYEAGFAVREGTPGSRHEIVGTSAATKVSTMVATTIQITIFTQLLREFATEAPSRSRSSDRSGGPGRAQNDPPGPSSNTEALASAYRA